MFQRVVTLVLLLALGAVPAAAGDLDAMLQGLSRRDAARAAGKPGLFPAYERLVGMESDAVTGETRVGVILRLSSDALPDFGGVDGLVVGSHAGDIATARLPLRSLAALAAVPGIRAIEASHLQVPMLDMAVPSGNVDDVWNGSPAYTGSGVLVGIIDSGIDYAHQDFKLANNSTRLKAIYDLFATGGSPPAGFGSGVEYTESQINAGTSPEKDFNGHGTHVSGIAAGDGSASGGQYKGVAFGADMLFAKAYDDNSGGFPEDKTIDAMNYLKMKAASLGKPIAINMSLGGHSGPHDGTTAQESLVNSLSGPGVVFCIAAGNEGEDLIHSSASAGSGTLSFAVGSYTPNPGGGQGNPNDVAAIEIWVPGNGSPTVTVTGPTGGTSNAVAPGGTFGDGTANGVIIVDNASTGVQPNGDKVIFIELDDQLGTAPSVGNWTISLTGGTGTAHAWAIFTSMPAGFPTSDDSYSVGMPGCAEKAVCVAAYKTRNNWPSLAGNVGYGAGSSMGMVPIGGRASFSSQGPTRDGRQKPDVIAPGAMIISVYSKDTTPVPQNELRVGTSYVGEQGTSMATPFTTGVAALMLEKNHTLTADQVRTTLRSTAHTDGMTGTVWNNKYGAGKVDAAAAVAAVSGGGGGQAQTGDINGDQGVDVRDVVKGVNFIVDPSGHPLTTAERQRGDVFPTGGGDGILNTQDITRMVNFILQLDAPSAPESGVGPAAVAVSAPIRSATGSRIEVEISGDAVAGGQFALTLPGASWDEGAVRVDGAPLGVAAHAVGDQIRVLLYDLGNRIPESGVRVVLPFRGAEAAAEARVTGLLLADPGGFAREVRVEGNDAALGAVRFLQAAPNPVLTRTVISFQLARDTEVRLHVFDLQGRTVRELVGGTLPAGLQEVEWDGKGDRGESLPAGVYFYRLSTPETTLTRKLVIQG